MSHRTSAIVIATFATIVFPIVALGQYPVDTQVGQVDNRVNGELYGNDRQPIRQPYQTRLLPSEERFAITRSGALPSEVRMAEHAAGPLTPNGVLDYLPWQSPLQRAMHAPAPVLVNPAYNAAINRQVAVQPAFAAPRGYPQTLRQGMLASHYVPGTPPNANPYRPQRIVAIPSLMPNTDRPLATGPLFDDVRYDPNSTPGASLLSRPVTTTQPSLSEAQPRQELQPSQQQQGGPKQR